MKILVCGGAGYIGSHLVREILRDGKHTVVIVDSLKATNGRRDHVDFMVPVEVGDVRDAAFLDRVFTKHKPDAVVHMCAFLVVPESVREPLMYFDNNVIGAVRIAEAMKNHHCNYLIFSSTAALFGTPEKSPIEPDAATHPESPYGDTKLASEWLFRACGAAYGLKYVFLRYFNACGADKDGDIGETHKPESHLIPLILQVPLGQRKSISIFGSDYPTPDGTCLRDYVHVTDLAAAHLLALEYLAKGGQSDCFNLGNGEGHSVRQVIETARKVTGHPIPAVEAPRRPGDPPTLVASASKARQVLGWAPKYSSLEAIVASAWKFHSTHPDGYGYPELQPATAATSKKTLTCTVQ